MGYLAPLFSVLLITMGIIALIILSYRDWRQEHQDAPFSQYFTFYPESRQSQVSAPQPVQNPVE